MSTQLDYQVGLGRETTYGTPATPDRFFETEGELEADFQYVQGAVLRPRRRVDRLDRRALDKVEVSGDMTVEVPTAGIGYLLAAALGTTTVTETETTGVFQQVHTPVLDDWLPSFTIQELLPRLGGTQSAHTFTGCQASEIELSIKQGQFLQLKVSWVGKDYRTDQTAVAASYPADLGLFAFIGAQVGFAGSLTAQTPTTLAALSGDPAGNVQEISVKITNNLDDNGFNLGGHGRRSRPAALGKADITGSITVEYTDDTLRDAYIAGTPIPLILTCQGDTALAGEEYPTLQVVLPSIVLGGEIPKSNKGDVITQSVDFTAVDNGTDEPIAVVYRSADSAV